jgi:hypothetical protein
VVAAFKATPGRSTNDKNFIRDLSVQGRRLYVELRRVAAFGGKKSRVQNLGPI